MVTNKFFACFHTFQSTEHNRIFIIESDVELKEFPKVTSAQNLDLFDYVNSKFVYVERHKKQMVKLYRDLMTEKCELERDVIRNTLTLAATSPDQSGYLLTKAPGSLVFLAGEAFHLIKCIPVPVQFRPTTECYQELPITHNQRNFYLIPRTHIITETGVRTTCNKLAPPYFKIGSKWFKMLPEIVGTPAPVTLNPKLRNIWEYIDPLVLAEAGLYSSEQRDSLKNHLMLSVDRSRVLHTFAHGLLGHNVSHERPDISPFMNAQVITKAITGYFSAFYGNFLTFGTISAGFIGAVFIFRIIKFFLDTLVHGISLYAIYGFSYHLIASLWDSLTGYFLTVATYNRVNQNNNDSGANSPTATAESSNQIREHERQNEEGEHDTHPVRETAFTPNAPHEIEIRVHSENLKRPREEHIYEPVPLTDRYNAAENWDAPAHDHKQDRIEVRETPAKEQALYPPLKNARIRDNYTPTNGD